VESSDLSEFEKNLFYKIRDSSFNLSLIAQSDYVSSDSSLKHVINFYLNAVK